MACQREDRGDFVGEYMTEYDVKFNVDDPEWCQKCVGAPLPVISRPT